MDEQIYEQVQAILLNSQGAPRLVVRAAVRAVLEFADGEDLLGDATLEALEVFAEGSEDRASRWTSEVPAEVVTLRPGEDPVTAERKRILQGMRDPKLREAYVLGGSLMLFRRLEQLIDPEGKL